MSYDILYRATELRAAEGRNVFGTVVPYGVDTQISELGRTYTERFQVGAFARSILERGAKVRLLVSHDSTKLPIGRATELVESARGLEASFLVADVAAGNDALELVRSGVVDSFSVGFRPIKSRQDGNVTVRVEAALFEVSLVGFPAYAGANVAGIRSARSTVSVDMATRSINLLITKAWPDLTIHSHRSE